MIYASREITRKAIRKLLSKNIIKHNSEQNNSFCTSVNCSPIPKRTGKEGSHSSAFKNANGAELIYR